LYLNEPIMVEFEALAEFSIVMMLQITNHKL
jgi:hypothetical protein